MNIELLIKVLAARGIIDPKKRKAKIDEIIKKQEKRDQQRSIDPLKPYKIKQENKKMELLILGLILGLAAAMSPTLWVVSGIVKEILNFNNIVKEILKESK